MPSLAVDSLFLRAKTIINFICARNITGKKPVFRGLENNVFTIDFQTAVACPARAVQCIVFAASGKKYDLSPLGLNSGMLKIAVLYSCLINYFQGRIQDFRNV